MKIKTGFILAIVVFLVFILFKGSIKNDSAQLLFVGVFILAELVIILLVAKELKKSKW
ncbi:hypothetical protein [Pararhodonellum marinum]|uniref:hypothetical protein n=1 Tax=Pararhodonellum marinum TaxID=2755358 RepID=UPI00188E6006|nr:hypothetical protein [Pararhodonellum marinum]